MASFIETTGTNKSNIHIYNKEVPMSNKNISRRSFIRTASVAPLAFSIVPSFVLGNSAPSTKLNIAAIGIGGMGSANLSHCEGENIGDICDVTWYKQP